MAANAPENVRRLLAWQKKNPPEPRPETFKEWHATERPFKLKCKGKVGGMRQGRPW